MSLDVGAALRDGASRTAERNGLVLMVGFLVVGLASLVVRQTFSAWYFEAVRSMSSEPLAFETPALPLAVGLPPAATVALWLALALLAEALRVVAVRTMVSDHTDRIPATLVRRNLGLATLNGFVGGVVVAVLVGLGSLALIVPGVFLAVSFIFVRQEIAVQDENFVDAMVNSWELASGNRVELAVLGIVWVTASLMLAAVSAGLGALLPAGSVVVPAVSVTLSAPVTVFVVATAARAYVQLREGADAGAQQEDAPPGGDTDEEEEEWPDPPGVDI